MADPVAKLSLHAAGTPTALDVSSGLTPESLPAVVVPQTESLHEDFSLSPAPCDLIVPHAQLPALATHGIDGVNDDEPENNGVGTIPGVDIDGRILDNNGDDDDDDIPSDEDESEGNDMVSESKAEPVDQGSGRISEEDSQLFHRSKSSTKHTEAWARARFDAWRTLQKRPTNLSIEELGDLDMKELGETVWMFLTQVRKQNGKEYPAETIGSLLRAIGRILRAHQDARILQTQVPEVPFNVMSDFRFKKAQVTVSETISLASRLGTGRRRKRVGVLTLGDEAAMLAKSTYVNDTAKGCSMRFAYFCTRNFFIRGSTALHELTDLDFTLGSDEHGEFLRFDRRHKNSKPDQPGQREKAFRPVTCYIEDVVSTYRAMIEHRPKWSDDEPPPHPLFLTDIRNPTSRTVWYTRMPVGVRALSSWLKTMSKDTGLGGEYYANKTGRATGIGRLQYAGVPIEPDAMGPRISGTYPKDDPEFEGIRERAMQRIVSGEVDKATGRLVDWSKALALEMELSQKPQISGTTCIQPMGVQSYRPEPCTVCHCQDITYETAEPQMPMAVTCSVTDNHNARPKNAYEQHRALVDELEKTKEKLISIERKLQGLEFEHSQDSDQLPPPYTDIVFESTEGRKVYAHKAVLVNQSDVFKTMFSERMGESDSLKMEIGYPALDAFVLFFYRGNVNHHTLRTHLVELLQVADKYGVTSLKSLCEQEILNSLNPSKVLVTYVVGWRHNSDVVKEGVIAYAATQVDDVSGLEGYDTFSKNCPEAVMELYEGVVKRLKRKSQGGEALLAITGNLLTHVNSYWTDRYSLWRQFFPSIFGP